MSFEDWQYRQAEKHAHNEILAFLIIIMGINLLATGLIITILTTGQPVLFPYPLPQYINLPIALGLILTDSGFTIILAGFTLSIHYDKQRTWHLNQIDKSSQRKNWKINLTTNNEILKELKTEKKKLEDPKQRPRGSKHQRT